MSEQIVRDLQRALKVLHLWCLFTFQRMKPRVLVFTFQRTLNHQGVKISLLFFRKREVNSHIHNLDLPILQGKKFLCTYMVHVALTASLQREKTRAWRINVIATRDNTLSLIQSPDVCFQDNIQILKMYWIYQRQSFQRVCTTDGWKNH